VIDVRLALRSILKSDSATSALTSSGARIFPVRSPQGLRFPHVVYNLVSEREDYKMSGSTGLMNAQMQVDCWADVAEDSYALARAVHDALSGFKGGVLPVSSNSPEETIEVRGIFLSSGRENYDAAVEMFRTSRDYFVWYAAR